MRAGNVPRYCHLCGRALAGRFFRYANGLVVCASCERSLPRCARCNIPLAASASASAKASAPGRERGRAPASVPSDRAQAQGSQAGGPPICAQCMRTAPRCACCGAPITHAWYTFEELLPPSAVRRFCESCVKHRSRCDVCRAPVPANAVILPDGQFRCALCATEMVLDDEAVAAVYAEALALAEQAAHVRPREVPALSVAGRREMGGLRRRLPGEMPGGIGGHHVLGFYMREGGASCIYVELGLPRPLLLGTLAHELAHAWQAEVAPALSDPLLREGFAEWVAHRVLVAGGHRRVAAHATRRDDLYGRGLRHFLGVERALGRAGVLDSIRGTPAARNEPGR